MKEIMTTPCLESESSPWHEELGMLLAALDDSPLECDGLTHAVSFVLHEAGIKHRCAIGFVMDADTGNCVAPHVWVELADGWIVDFRLRMWLGDEDRVPHGVFHPASNKTFQFHGEYRDRSSTINHRVLDMMTEGRLSHVKVSREFVEENRNVRV